MKKWISGLVLTLATIYAQAEIAPILLEACNAMEPASKRMECLRAANRVEGVPGSALTYNTQPQSAYSAPATKTARVRPSTGPGGATCHVGPRGGTYTITASGRKNYGGC